MKLLLTAAALAALVLSLQTAAQAECPATIRSAIEVPPGKFTLADLLTAGACPALLQAAAAVALGSAPLAGSRRVLEGDQVGALMEAVAAHVGNGPGAPIAMQIPARITVRRAGSRAACADIRAELLASWERGRGLRPSQGEPGIGLDEILSGEIDCAAGGRIQREAALQLSGAVWDRALRSWEVSARCVHAGDCVPFLVRSRARDDIPRGTPIFRMKYSVPDDAIGSNVAVTQPASVKPGQKASLVWEQGGFRVTLRVTCLDRGRVGESVRARVEGGARVLRAEVVGEGSLRVAP